LCKTTFHGGSVRTFSLVRVPCSFFGFVLGWGDPTLAERFDEELRGFGERRWF